MRISSCGIVGGPCEGWAGVLLTRDKPRGVYPRVFIRFSAWKVLIDPGPNQSNSESGGEHWYRFYRQCEALWEGDGIDTSQVEKPNGTDITHMLLLCEPSIQKREELYWRFESTKPLCNFKFHYRTTEALKTRKMLPGPELQAVEMGGEEGGIERKGCNRKGIRWEGIEMRFAARKLGPSSAVRLSTLHVKSVRHIGATHFPRIRSPGFTCQTPCQNHIDERLGNSIPFFATHSALSPALQFFGASSTRIFPPLAP